MKKSLIWLLSYTLTSKRLAENENGVKIVLLTSCTRVVLHPSCKTTFSSPGRVCKNSLDMNGLIFQGFDMITVMIPSFPTDRSGQTV